MPCWHTCMIQKLCRLKGVEIRAGNHAVLAHIDVFLWFRAAAWPIAACPCTAVCARSQMR